MTDKEALHIGTTSSRKRLSVMELYGIKDDDDVDAATDRMLWQERQTWSKGRIQKMKLKSVLAGNSLPSRKKVFTTVQLESDYKLFTISVHNKTISCAKVFNPALLDRRSKIWSKLSTVQRFELEDPESILTAIPKHYATKMEHLESFSITWTRVNFLPNELFQEGLKTLNLERNQLKSLNGIEKAVNLTNLNASSNLLTELPKTFGQLTNLTNLNISGNAITELPENIGCLNQLRLLDCSSNSLSFLPDSICNLIELICFDVSNNQLTKLPNSIGNMPKLEDFRARANHLQSLPEKFGLLTMLSSLTLRKNKFVDMPVQLSKIASLQSLNMRDNSIKSFSLVIPSLKSLILDSNKLEDIGDEILNCSNVQMLSLENNRISVIPADIKKLRNLRVLHLSGNDIKVVPEDIGQLDHLRHLSLSETQIQTLPNAILTMKSLNKLDISDCPNMTSYLKLAHKNGGLPELRKEMLKSSSVDISNTCSEGSTGSQNDRYESDNAYEAEIIQRCKRHTVFNLSGQLPTSETDVRETHDIIWTATSDEKEPTQKLPTVTENGDQEINTSSMPPIYAYMTGNVQKNIRPPTKPKLGKLKTADQTKTAIVMNAYEVQEDTVRADESAWKTNKRQSTV